MAFWVYFSGKGKETNRNFSLMIVSILFWIDSYHFASFLSKNDLSLKFFKISTVSVFIFFIFYYYFIISFLNKKDLYKYFGKIVFVFGIFGCLITIFTEYIVPSIEVRDWGNYLKFSSLGWFLFYGYVIFLTILINIILLRDYFSSSKNEKNKMQYFLIGFFIFAGLNSIFNIILPAFFANYKFFQIGNYSTIILVSFTAYAIVKHELMGIKTLLTQALIVLTSIILLIDIVFLSDNPTMQLLKLGILVAFLYFSREMVRSVRKEKEAREQLEKINTYLEEKTQDLVALLSLNDMISVGVEIEKSVQNIMDAVPEKLGHLGIMGTFLIRYDEKRNRVYAYITTESAVVGKAKKILFKPKLSDYVLNIDTKNPQKHGLVVKSILNNEIEKGTNLADFISPPVKRSAALLMQKSLGGKTFVSVPMTIRGRKKGALVFMFIKDIAEVGSRDLDLIKAFTQHVSVVMDNLHFYHNLNRNIEELTRAKDKLKETLSMKNDFLHIVSHQLRTPLTAMRGFISMWNEGDFNALSKDKMDEIKIRIVNNAERLNSIVNDMVTAMESEGELKVEFKSVDLAKILAGDIEMLKPNFEKKDLYLKYKEITKNIPKIEADGKLLFNVFMNLIDNAEKYTDKGGLIITIGQNGDNIRISFTDTGIGLSKEDKKILFKKFSRGAKSNYINPNGSGLGLFIIKQIIRKHHGEIKASSKGEGKGSTFTITLPIVNGK